MDETLWDFAFVSNDRGYAVGQNGTIIYTTDGGTRWEIQDSGIQSPIPMYTPHLQSVFFTDHMTGYIVGDSGKILKTTTGGVMSIKDNVNTQPEYFLLDQNFPNPFNPVTQITYSLPKASFVELKIYNLMGREIATLVSEKQMAGKYQLEFNGESFPSGVYFYKLETPQYVETKRLLILR
jgi:hypothetical protein